VQQLEISSNDPRTFSPPMIQSASVSSAWESLTPISMTLAISTAKGELRWFGCCPQMPE